MTTFHCDRDTNMIFITVSLIKICIKIRKNRKLYKKIPATVLIPISFNERKNTVKDT